MAGRAKAGLDRVLNTAKTSENMSQDVLEEVKKVKQHQERDKMTAKETGASGRQVIAVVFVVVILFGLFIFIGSLQSKSQSLTIDDYHQRNIEGKESDINYMYNGYSFVKAMDLWHTEIADNKKNRLYELAVRYSPKEVLDIKVAGPGLDKDVMNMSTIYISHDPDSANMNYVALAAAEITLSVSGVIGMDVKAACMKNITGVCETIPIKTCADKDSFVLEIYDGEQTAVIFDGNCIKIQGRQEELMRAADRLLFEWLGIIRPQK
ncbi:hypothetical protein COV93_01080 [Candidatus Woesearchaeota archaeon CG11_big_fil_rev_8_21_14_0_20_43_8]|nr:MAG: hypothetical protein COV93_01080 [Candidatus Woesearchaeota archaeon CG11_big_fil_rev_8_21_14_0_20_43_8]PIO04988.1 MAG: hypothetical protein COT47_06640 [Candidatus Woesearchaeota archaeon CG08_land_8_20_14_0_20_43_7]